MILYLWRISLCGFACDIIHDDRSSIQSIKNNTHYYDKYLRIHCMEKFRQDRVNLFELRIE